MDDGNKSLGILTFTAALIEYYITFAQLRVLHDVRHNFSPWIALELNAIDANIIN